MRFKVNPDTNSERTRERNGLAALSTRVRVGEFSNVRAIAEMNNGQLQMASTFVKASGGSDVVPFEDKAVDKRLGSMKLCLPGVALQQMSGQTGARIADLLIQHPNFIGMQASDTSGVMIPMRTLDHVEVFYDDKPILRVEGCLSLSHNPKFRFLCVRQDDVGSGLGGGFSVRLLDSAKAKLQRSRPAQRVSIAPRVSRTDSRRSALHCFARIVSLALFDS